MTDRNSWVTPKWLADIIGPVDLDPCSNARSHILASTSLTLEAGDDGCPPSIRYTPGDFLLPAVGGGYECQNANDPKRMRVFVNPPYGRGETLRWVEHWMHSNTIFLLRWDPSTEWFARLHHRLMWVWHPKQRIQFDPPEGVKASSNPFPHALFGVALPSNGLHERFRQAQSDGFFQWV